MKEFKRILKKHGRLILTTPFAAEYKVLPLRDAYERIYNYENIQALFKGWKIIREEYYIPKKAKHWIKATREEAEKMYNAYKRSNLSCFVLEKVEMKERIKSRKFVEKFSWDKLTDEFEEILGEVTCKYI